MTASMPDTAPVQYDVSDGVATIRLNRPDAMNSLDIATKELLRETVQHAAEDEAARCVVLTGTGRAFCTGQDLKEHVALLQSGSSAQLFTTVERHYNPTVTALATMEKPVVAAVNGVAAGAGASLAFACDLRIVADTAGFNLAFANVALSCDTGSSYTLQRLVLDLNGIEPVPALLLIPDKRQARAPGLLYIHWHGGMYDLGKEMLLKGVTVAPAYAPACAEKGIVTLATNAPGPRHRLRLMGQRMDRVLPIPPTAQWLSTGVAVLSYGDERVFGITADYDAARDMERLAAAIELGMARLVALSDDSVLLFSRDRRTRSSRALTGSGQRRRTSPPPARARR